MGIITDSYRDSDGNLLLDRNKNVTSFKVTRGGVTKTLEDWVFEPSEVNFDSDIVASGTLTPRPLDERFAEVANPVDFGAIRSPRSLLEQYGDVTAARAAYPGIYISDGQESVDWAALQAAIATGKRVFIPPGDYYINEELEVVHAGQVIEFAGTGGYGYGEDVGGDWQSNPATNARIITGTGRTFPQRVRTRRLYRGSSSDPQDTALSVGINVQAEGVHLIRPCLWNRTDYTNDNDFGYYVHCGIFVGTRVGVQIYSPVIIGYYRRAGIYIDVSGHTSLPRFNARDGSPYPEGTVKNGADGTHIHNPYIRLARIGLAVLGALPAPGNTGYGPDYYDELLGSTVIDRRGSFGASDFLCIGGRIYGADRADNRRVGNPSSSTLSQSSLNAEPDDAPAAVYLSGLAGNASGSIWGMRFIGTRIATFEMFRMRLHHAARVSLYDCHIEGRNGGRMNTSGTVIDTNNYTSHSYGDIAATSTVRDVLWHGSVRQTPTDGAYNHFYGTGASLKTDSGRDYIADGAFVASRTGEIDIRAAGTNDAVRLRNGDNTSCVFEQNAALIKGAGASTVGSSANAYLSTGGSLSRSTSARKYKTDITPVTPEFLRSVMELGGVFYRPSELAGDTDKTRRFIGFIADEADESGLTELVHYSEDGEVEGFQYERMVVVHQEVLKTQQDTIEALMSRVQALETQVNGS